MNLPANKSLFDRIHAALPQTQCTRCGYPDCAAYAQAIASGDALNGNRTQNIAFVCDRMIESGNKLLNATLPGIMKVELMQIAFRRNAAG